MTGPSIVKLLLEHGADVHTRYLQGKTPLMLAVSGQDSIDVIMMLLEMGARVGDRDKNGHNAIWHARQGQPTRERRQTIAILEKTLEWENGEGG
ncbi:hypothetical protein F5X68DRAFT_213303 [Plectosphaerella plurivora]|uniref:Ankyrin repeat protein n=1 Tax=Plectosphaerella plurivora TaxID=936078 RepID=A0A9P8V5D7_9PEZI|nr:hypothetical protein F5X68DRAFT_213303 [Plectosphaerella plurivora]